MTEASTLIELQNVSYRYNQTPVLENVTLSLKKGGFYLLIGPNGGGKTTLLKIILGLLSPTSGTITIGGKSPQESASSIGYVPQALVFDPLFPLSTLEFVLMGELSKLSWYGTWPKGTMEKALELLSFVGIEKEKDRAIGSLSGGQRQRASFARALINDPELIILDEPTTGLDPEISHLIQAKILETRGNRTILFVTHTIPDFLGEVDEVLSVKGTVERLKKETLCIHHTLGVYHIATRGKN